METMNETSPAPAPRTEHTPAWLSIPLAVLIAAAMVSGSILYVGSGGTASLLGAAQTPDPSAGDAPVKVDDPDSLVESDDPVLGKADAPVTIVEFSDFQCPFCRRFWADTYTQLKEEYIDTGKARLVFRDYPLPFHEAATPSALAANCANEQGKFWQYHDKMFIEQEKQGQGTVSYGVTELKAWAQQIGLNMTQFNQCLDSKKYADEVEADTTAGSANGVSGTPSFFVNGQLLVGAQPFASFKALIDAELE